MDTMSNKISTIAKNIKKIRKKKGISQDKLSKLAEVAYNTIFILKLNQVLFKIPQLKLSER